MSTHKIRFGAKMIKLSKTVMSLSPDLKLIIFQNGNFRTVTNLAQDEDIQAEPLVACDL